MFTILNRYRGTYGWFAKVNGVVLGLLTYFVYGDIYVSIAVTIGYVAGESFGWGEWIGTLTSNATKYEVNEEGKNNGIRWLASKIIDPDKAYREYCRVALTIRGLYWWVLALAPLYFVADWFVITLAIFILSIAFPIACELGRLTAPLFSFEYKTFSIKGGWEHQEIWYGLIQDIVFVGVVLCLG